MVQDILTQIPGMLHNGALPWWSFAVEIAFYFVLIVAVIGTVAVLALRQPGKVS